MSRLTIDAIKRKRAARLKVKYRRFKAQRALVVSVAEEGRYCSGFPIMSFGNGMWLQTPLPKQKEKLVSRFIENWLHNAKVREFNEMVLDYGAVCGHNR